MAERDEVQDDRVQDDQIDRDLAAQRSKGKGAGISNRPLDQEKREQESLPPRLNARDADATGSAGAPGVRGEGAQGRLTGPRPPTSDAPDVQPLMGVVPPEPTSADEAGDVDYTHGDATRVREAMRGSQPSEGEDAADEAKRRELYRRGASNVSKG